MKIDCAQLPSADYTYVNVLVSFGSPEPKLPRGKVIVTCALK